MGLETKHLCPLYLREELWKQECAHVLEYHLVLSWPCLKYSPLLLSGSPASGAEQQLWQCAPPLAGHHDQGRRVSEDAQRYVSFKSHVSCLLLSMRIPQGEVMRAKLGMIEGR